MSYLTEFTEKVKDKKFVIVDTETTGLGETDEIVSIAVVDHLGHVLFDTLVIPTQTISAAATSIHKITNDMAKGGRRWHDVEHRLRELTKDKVVVIYNAEFDLRLIRQTNRNNFGFMADVFDVYDFDAECAMLAYAEYFGEWNGYRESYRWQRLTSAAHQCSVPQLNAHSALGDCMMTLGVTKYMLENPKSK